MIYTNNMGSKNIILAYDDFELSKIIKINKNEIIFLEVPIIKQSLQDY